MQRIIYTKKNYRIVEEADANAEGTFGYSLEKWNPRVGKGWECMDSCWDFEGSYNPKDKKFCHYIVKELKIQLNSLLKSEGK